MSGHAISISRSRLAPKNGASRLAPKNRGASRLAPEGGVALILTLMAMLLVSAFGTAAILATSVESRIAGNFRAGIEIQYAAEAAAERVMADLVTAPDWDPYLRGEAAAPFRDGVPAGVRTLADGTTVNLSAILSLANCGRLTTCSQVEMERVTAERPWGVNNPAWRPYAYGPLSMAGAGSEMTSQAYVVVLVADDPAEDDGDATRDGLRAEDNPGAGTMLVRVEAFGLWGAHRALEFTLSRQPLSEDADAGESVRLVSWRVRS